MKTTMPLPVVDCDHALVIWVASTTVGAERHRLISQLAKARSVFGLHAEYAQPSNQTLNDQLQALSGRPTEETLVPEPHRFGATHASKLLPRGARIVGWLDGEGYRRVAGAPQPDDAWLDEASEQIAA